ncbi:MAG: TRAP transporter small permease [candidate division NC10 bacterium]|nr:TRAP transporter small permease [candidate division NC10 bacterium]
MGRFIRGCEYLISVMLAVMLASILLQVVLRNVFSFGFVWTEELARYSMIWLVFVGAIVSLRRGSHIAMTMLADALPSGLRKAAHLTTLLLMGMFVLILCWLSTQLSLSPLIRNQLTPGLGIPTSWVYSSLTLSAGAMLLVIIDLIKQTLSAQAQ